MKGTNVSVLLVLGAVVSGAGCAWDHGSSTASSPPPVKAAEPVRPVELAAQPAPATESSYTYRPVVPAGYSATVLAFPSGDLCNSELLVHEIMPNQVRIGQPYAYEIHVTNLTGGVLQNVLLTTESTQNAILVSSSPAPTRAQIGSTQWLIGDLAPQRTQIVKVTARPEKTGMSGNCVTVSYNNSLCAMTQVVEPSLALTKTATTEALVCDPVVIKYEVRNPGSGSADNVRILDTLPPGLTTAEGAGAIDLDVGTLKAGESKVLTVNAKATKTGRYESQATATGAGGLMADSSPITTVIRQPVLAISCKGVDRTFIGREATFEFTVKNTGDGVSSDTVLSVPAPVGAKFVRATDGVVPTTGVITWRLGTLAAGQSRAVSATFSAAEAATIRVAGSVQGYCATTVNAGALTSVVGIPALLLDGNDEPDPVQVGDSSTYTLTLTNQGSAPLTNVKLVCSLEIETMEVVSQTGVSAGAVSGGTITFAPIARLEPKAKATYKIVIRAKKEGQVQFKAEASSDQITRALVKTETTNFYR